MSAASSTGAAMDAAPCLFCSEPEQVGVAEVWTDGTFLLHCCCEGLHEWVARCMTDDPAFARQLLQQAGIEDLTGHRLRRIADDGGSGLVLDYQLQHRPIGIPAARAFVARHHAHCGQPAVSRFAGAVFNGWHLIGVAMVGNPVARALNGRGILEVNRLCVRRDVPRALAWNAASMLYGWTAREAARRGWAKLITYTRADEKGTSLAAAGWVREAVVRGRGWHSRTRQRSNTNGWVDKVRWSRTLRQPCGVRTSKHLHGNRPGPDDLLDRLLTFGPPTTGLTAGP